MSGRYRSIVRSYLDFGPVVHSDHPVTGQDVLDVSLLAALGPGERFDVLGPAEPGLYVRPIHGHRTEGDELGSGAVEFEQLVRWTGFSPEESVVCQHPP